MERDPYEVTRKVFDRFLEAYGIQDYFYVYDAKLGVGNSVSLPVAKSGSLEIVPDGEIRYVVLDGVPIGFSSREGTFISLDHFDPSDLSKIETLVAGLRDIILRKK